VPALDEFSIFLCSSTSDDVPSGAVEARDALEPLLRHLEEASKTAKGSLAGIAAAVESAVALRAFQKGSFPAVEALVAKERSLVEEALSKALVESPTTAPPRRRRGESLSKFVERLFKAAIDAAFPGLGWKDAAVMRCGNEKFGDFQCNAPMSVFKALKTAKSSEAALLKSPRDVGAAIAANLPENDVLDNVTVAPAGFVNTTVKNSVVGATALGIAASNAAAPPDADFCFGGRKKVLVDFSSPNIAKEMHVGHLRSTIIGDTLSRVLEFCGHDVARVNHVGDWGTQYGMMICEIRDSYGAKFFEERPTITDLTVSYKKAKKRFDEEPGFKERARQTVVVLQSGEDPEYRKIWEFLCELSRKEFDKVYDRLDIHLEEFGESYYNDMIPPTIDELLQRSRQQGKGAAAKSSSAGNTNGDDSAAEELPFVEVDEQDAVFVHLPGRGYPLILRKSDGGYGYDSTDMAALRHRIFDLKKDWLVYVTDLGQRDHFHMCFQAAEIAGWLDSEHHKLRHVGFGVVQGDDGKRFKTRSGDTVRLVDLLDAAVDRMRDSLKARVEDGKCPLNEKEVEEAAAVIGYGGVKYFDLHQHPETNYQFSYDKMLSTSGNTAVYLLFAHARLASILRKADADVAALLETKNGSSSYDLTAHPKERSLAFELGFFTEVVEAVANEYQPSRLCDFLYKLATKFTEFVTECKVLGDPRQSERLLLCAATGIVMRQSFDLLGIKHLDRI